MLKLNLHQLLVNINFQSQQLIMYNGCSKNLGSLKTLSGGQKPGLFDLFFGFCAVFCQGG